ncbi:glycoside hydrolase superfamily [Tribonema minus]|uniref:Glycoside hydrolase superfamily n=1 Tax=Tribonema minus TaxID=303371 RepID=A0A835Z8N1_9STRA|nr:glycoside hydrolase superfamily [Tribonema minus]
MNRLPLGYFSCCGSGIRSQGRTCADKDAPCGLPASGMTPSPTTAPASSAADPACANGILNKDGSVCCTKPCGQCGGTGCNTFTGGSSNCCAGPIRTANKSCTQYAAPCVMGATSGTPKPTTRKTMVGVQPGGTPLGTREGQYGVKVDSLLMFQKVTDLHFDWVATEMNRGHTVQLVLEFFGTSLKDIAAGGSDGVLSDFANKAKTDGRQFYIRPLHEFNGDWYPWGIYVDGTLHTDLLSDFKAAYKHIVTIFRNAKAPVQFQQGYNNSNPRDDKTPFKNFYVGDDYVDMVCFSLYNFAGIPNHSSGTFTKLAGDFYNQMTLATSKDLCISEMSTTSYGVDKPAWIKDTWSSIANQFTRITTVNWFLENKPDGNWDLNNGPEQQAWINGLNSFRSTTAVRRAALQLGAPGDQ